MSKSHRRLILLSVLLGAEAVLVAFGYLSTYLQIYDDKGVLATVTYVLQQLLSQAPLFAAVGIALCRARLFGLASAFSLLLPLLPFTFLYQLALTFLDYYFLQDELLGTGILLGVMNGLGAGILMNAILFTLLLLLPYLLFLRTEQGRRQGGAVYAAITAAICVLVYGLIEEAVALVVYLSEHFWIIYRAEVVSFILFCLLRVALAAFCFAAVRIADRRWETYIRRSGKL